jgi:hypothetical protein
VAASQFTDERDVDSAQLPEELKRLTGEIRKRIRISSLAGLIAMGLFLGLIAVVLFVDDNDASTWDVFVDNQAVAGLSRSCPGATDGLVRAQVHAQDLENSSRPLRLEISAEQCGTEDDISIRLDRGHVELLLEVSP